MNVLSSEDLVRATSGNRTIQIYDNNGNRRSNSQIEADARVIAADWVGGLFRALISQWKTLNGKSENFTLVGRTSDGTEFQRSYQFYFIGADEDTFNATLDYCVLNNKVVVCTK